MKNNFENQMSIFDLFEEVNSEEVNNKEEIENQEYFVGEEVLITYEGTEYTGKITRIYNSGDTINVCFNNGIAPFYKDYVRKIS